MDLAVSFTCWGRKGEGKIRRKTKPRDWREDLISEQARIVERITAPLLKELHPF